MKGIKIVWVLQGILIGFVIGIILITIKSYLFHSGISSILTPPYGENVLIFIYQILMAAYYYPRVRRLKSRMAMSKQ
jgi:hypothetical protein